MKNFEKIIDDLKKKKIKPVYFLMGEEHYFINEISNFIEKNFLNEKEKYFDQIILYGKDTNIYSIISYCKKYPIIANYNVVIVKEAQFLSKEINKLSSYIENPNPNSLLVLCYKSYFLEKNDFYKKIITYGVLYISKKIPEYKIFEFIKKQVKKLNLNISNNACFLIKEYLGTNISLIINELKKITIFLPKNSIITSSIVKKHININIKYNYFELQKKIAKKDFIGLSKIFSFFIKNEKDYPIFIILEKLNNFFFILIKYHLFFSFYKKSELYKILNIPYFALKDYTFASYFFSLKECIKIISYIREADIFSKKITNVSIKNGKILKELLFKIIHQL